MMGMFVETGDEFSRQTPAEGKHEIVVRKLSFDLATRDSDGSFVRIDVGNFGFNEVDSSIQHRVPKVEGNILGAAFIESESHEGGIKNKLPAARDERDLMFCTELLGQTLRGHDTTETATQDQNLRHQATVPFVPNYS